VLLLLGMGFIPAAAAAPEKVLLMATTTSTEETGLLPAVASAFQKASGIELRWTAAGTGKALKLGENCDVDIVMVHAPEAEKQFVADGFGVNRRPIMSNDFVILGPAADPAGVRGKGVREALAAVQARKALFVSRGDRSGTHMLEISLWKASGMPVPEREAWYVQAGQGMLATIAIAAEKNGYTLADRGTYIRFENNRGGDPPLKILVAGDPMLVNLYSVIAVNPARCPQARADLAAELTRWIAGPEGRKVIREFRVMGQPLFTPHSD
jgi:tungstate transport system substrate-binding protein